MKQNSPKKQSGLKFFVAAFAGIKIIFTNERNFRIHLIISIVVLTVCFFLKVTISEWVTVLLLIGFVLCTEALNTSIEFLCDHVTPEYHPMIKKVKDISAGAVLISAILAVIIGCIIFIPYLMHLL